MLAARSLLPTLLTCGLISACGGSTPDDQGGDNGGGTPDDPVFPALSHDLSDSAEWYANQTLDLLRVDLRTVIGTGPCVADDPNTPDIDEEDYSGCTLDDLRGDTDGDDDFDPFVPVHYSSDDFPNDASLSNAELEIRGATSRFAAQKSWKVKLDSKDALWRGERRLQLNKHPWELARVRNKLSFDLFQSIPHLPSLRTQFVQLYMDGEDHGLFTHVEHAGKEYLENRGWDEDSGLYKAGRFTFRERAEFALDAAGAPLDLNAFERRVEIKRGDDHRAFVEMLAAVNDFDNDFDADVLDRHFNRNNYLTWLAVNILTGNWDTQSQNFYLYNPLGTERFYFLPWDYDGAWGWDRQPSELAANKPERRWSRGVSNWWDVKLHKRFLQQPGSLARLNEVVETLKARHFQPSQIEARLASYKELIRPFISTVPDNTYLPRPSGTADVAALWDSDYDAIARQVQQNYDDFIALQESPMPFWLDGPSSDGATLTISWDASADLQGDAISYDIYLASDPAALPLTPDEAPGQATVLGFVPDDSYPSYSLPAPAAGDWYLKVFARDASNPGNNWQIAFDTHWAGDDRYHGVRAFTVD